MAKVTIDGFETEVPDGTTIHINYKEGWFRCDDRKDRRRDKRRGRR